MKKNLIIGLVAIALVVSGFLFFKTTDNSDANDIIVPVSKGKFVIDITTTGELEAKNSIEILGPTQLREFRVYNLTIQDIVEEGKVVRKGDWIANLDKSDFQSRLQDQEIDLEKKQSEFTQSQLDTTLQMRQARDELINLQYTVEEMQIKLDQSQYEPPATIKQAEIDLDKSKRALQQAKENYKIKLEQNKAKMTEVSAELRKSKKEYDQMVSLIDEFTIRAPEQGMVIYTKGWDGKPIKAGSQISTWRPVVATLPDLSVMLSKTYVNEVDVRKVKTGQTVEIGLDAFPDKKLTGVVTRVANVGEQRPNSDSKVFEATIEVEGTDKSLKPAMTTSNRIMIDEIDSALSIPLECLHSQYDSITYVFKKSGLNITKQEVLIGPVNNNAAIIESGLTQNDRVYMSVPGNMDEKPIELLAELNGKRMKKNTKDDENKADPGKKTITLPDGTTQTVGDDNNRPRRSQRSASTGGEGRRSNPN